MGDAADLVFDLMADHRFLTGAYVSLADLMVIPLLYYLGTASEGRPLLAEHRKAARLGPADGNAPELPGDETSRRSLSSP